MKREIEKLVELAKIDPSSEIVFYYAGHGLPDERTNSPFLIPVDGSATNVSEYGISLSDVYKKLASTNASKITIFIDACFSGGGRNEGLLAARSMKIKPKEEPFFGNMVVFASSSGEERSLPYNEKQHGIFSYFLFKKLKETKGKTTYLDLANYLDKEVKKNALINKGLIQSPKVIVSEEVINSWSNWLFVE